MYQRKYIFETRRTKFIRLVKNCFLLGFIFAVLYGSTAVVFILIAKKESKHAEESLYNKSPDLIVVFTGAKKRIPYAIRQAKKYNQFNIFITGVYAKNSVDTLLAPLKLSDSFRPDLLKIDYLARNTVENVISMYRYLKRNKNYERILIISHDYHLVRIKLINNIINDEEGYQFYYSGIKSRYNSYRSIKIIIVEVYKFIRALIFLMMWEA